MQIQFSTLEEKPWPPVASSQDDPNRMCEHPGSTYMGQSSALPPPYPYPSYPQPPNLPNQPVQKHVRSYMVWSVVNIIFGLLVLGCVAVIFSLLVIRYRRRQDYYRANRYRRFALITNVICSIVCIPIWIVIIYYGATASKRNT